MRVIQTIFMSILLLTLISSCARNKDSSLKYEIISEEKIETSNKAHLIEYVVYKDTNYIENALKNTLQEVYSENKNKDVFKNFDAPTIFVVYMYTSEEILKSNKSEWLCMLTMESSNSDPIISFNDLKLKSLQGLNDNSKSKNEVALDRLNDYLKERNLELCSINKQIVEMELKCIHKADAKYPNYGTEHSVYSNKLIEEERQKIAKKYNLADSILSNISIFSLSYCK